MKNLKFLIIALLFTCSLTTISPAKADPKQNNKENITSSDNRNKDDGASSPINNQILFIILTAVAIGCKLIADKHRGRKALTSQPFNYNKVNFSRKL
jgi:hypothetical protein